MGLLINGWESEVIQRATGPLTPFGTTHCEIGREMLNAKPPTIIWQKRPCSDTLIRNHHPLMSPAQLTSVDPLIAGELNVKSVPIATVPVFVRARGWFAGTPRSQPEMKPPAMAKTSLGVRARSNACGIAVPELRTFKIVW